MIIEGVCLLKIKETLHLNNTRLNVYVKKMSPIGYWLDEEECDISATYDDLAQNRLQIINRIKSIFGFSNEIGRLSTFRREVIKYHRIYKPHEVADIIYYRIED